ncbi:hypothetical protein [Cohnella hongkongensis]|uniref:Rho termination factor N-terminal domain-containing protein n=1 Tax=Cohnella hongkongensis TaxID=178337 RepID=A0ABV9FAU3_9BACL
MNLADMLCYADIAELKKIADTYECASTSHSKNELIQNILATVQRRDVIESRIREISGSDMRFLNSLVFENRNAYSLEELKARALDKSAPAGTAVAPPESGAGKKPAKSRKAKAAEQKPPPGPEELARLSISRFKSFGWLFSGFSQQTRSLFQVPEDIKSRLCDVLERRYKESLVYTGEPLAYRDERSLLAEDAVHFLRFVRSHIVPLTAEGVMYKRQLTQALDQLAVVEPLPTRGGWRFGYGRHFRDYPDRFSLLYDFVYYEGLVSESGAGHLTLTPAGTDVASGLVRPDPARMYRFWMRLYKGPIPNLSSTVQWIARLSAEWVTVDSLAEVLQPLIRPYYYDTATDIFEQRILKMLMHLGVLRWGETSRGQRVVRATPQGRALVSGHPLAYEDTLHLEANGNKP